MLRRLQELQARWSLVCDGFGIGTPRGQLKKVAEAALTKSVHVHLMAYDADERVRAKDISILDPGDSDDDVSGWGGLTGFGSRFGEAVRTAVNEAG